MKSWIGSLPVCCGVDLNIDPHRFFISPCLHAHGFGNIKWSGRWGGRDRGAGSGTMQYKQRSVCIAWGRLPTTCDCEFYSYNFEFLRNWCTRKYTNCIYIYLSQNITTVQNKQHYVGGQSRSSTYVCLNHRLRFCIGTPYPNKWSPPNHRIKFHLFLAQVHNSTSSFPKCFFFSKIIMILMTHSNNSLHAIFNAKLIIILSFHSCPEPVKNSPTLAYTGVHWRTLPLA